jgi:hypothetical protein
MGVDTMFTLYDTPGRYFLDEIGNYFPWTIREAGAGTPRGGPPHVARTRIFQQPDSSLGSLLIAPDGEEPNAG